MPAVCACRWKGAIRPLSRLERLPPGVGYLHADNLDPSLIVPHSFTRDGGEPVADEPRKQVACKTMGSENCLIGQA